jgi:MFS family permease
VKIHNRWYILGVMTLIYLLNFVDRQLITILAPYIKADLHIGDAQLGLLYGTAFALFYGLFGIPLAKLADVSSRVWTLTIGVAFWSVMTMLSGAAHSLTGLGLARIGVGIGEASASPSAVSLLGEYFERRRRGTAMSILSTGLYVGSGLSLILGGSIVAAWSVQFPLAELAPFGLVGWQAAFIIVGLPGLLVSALILLTVPEPARPVGARRVGFVGAVAAVLTEARTMFPPWSMAAIARRGDWKGLRFNLALMVALTIAAAAAIWVSDRLSLRGAASSIGTLYGVVVSGNAIQWIAIAIAIYASLSWTQSLRGRDPHAYDAIVASKPFLAITLVGGLIGIAMYSVQAFTFVYGVRYLGFGPGMGLKLGAIGAIAGTAGAVLGGMLGDRLILRHPAGRLYLLILTFTLFAIATGVQFTTGDPDIFLVGFGLATACLTPWNGIATATGQDVLPQSARGTGYAVQQLGCNVMGLGLGPYLVGLISDATGDLRQALLMVLMTVPLVIATLLWLIRAITAAEQDDERGRHHPQSRASLNKGA